MVTIITTPLWCRMGDRIGHKKMILRACSVLIMTELLIGFAINPFQVLAIRLVQGIFAGFTAAAQSWSIMISHPDSHGVVIGRMQAATAIGSIIGPVFGGFVANYFGYSSIFFISAIICSVTVMLLGIVLKNLIPNR